MRLSAFLEAWVQLVFAGEGTGSCPIRERSTFVPQQGVTELKTHHKVAAAPRNLGRAGRIEAVNRRAAAPRLSGSRRVPLLAQGDA